MQVLSIGERLLISALLVLVAVLVGLDVLADLQVGSSWRHVGTEIFIGLLAIAGVAMLWVRNFLLTHRLGELSASLSQATAQAEQWKQDNAVLLQGLSAAIDQQMEAWQYTKSEKEIALLLLKGLSLKEIAEVRKTGERTVRQQATGVYGKAGLAGRAELSAFFLEDLLLPQT